MYDRLTLLLLFLLLFSCNGPEEKQPAADSTTITKAEAPETSAFTYRILHERTYAYTLKDDSLKHEIDRFLDETENLTIDALTDELLELTTSRLEFAFRQCPSDPAALVKDPHANCIGYAAFFDVLMKYALKKKGWTKKYECRQYVGKISVAGKDVHQLFSSPFFKDHDFNVIKDRAAKTEFAVDPSLYEYLGTKRVALKTSVKEK